MKTESTEASGRTMPGAQTPARDRKGVSRHLPSDANPEVDRKAKLRSFAS